MAKPVRCLIYFFYPLGWPIAKLLQWILGAHHGIIYRRSELRELIKFHAAGAGGGGDLDNDTVTMAQGALDLAGKTVREAMTAIDQVFVRRHIHLGPLIGVDRITDAADRREARLRNAWISRQVWSFSRPGELNTSQRV